MALPSQIEIVPPTEGVCCQIGIPGSKSLTNRALVLAVLGSGSTTLEGALWSEDTQVMSDALRKLGFQLEISTDPTDPSNRQITVHGLGGSIPNGGSPVSPLDLWVGNAGTAARFLTALTCLGQGCYRLNGVARMCERPQAGLFAALRQLGYQLDSPNNRLPVIVHGTGPRKGRCTVSLKQSSQFASALMLVAPQGEWTVHLAQDNVDEAPYVRMTDQLRQAFPSTGGRFSIEPDASSGSYFWAANHLLRTRFGDAATVNVLRWPTSGWQIDQHFPSCLPLPPTLSRSTDLADSIMTAIVIAPLADRPVRFTNLGRLRLQECERVQALKTELSRCGAHVEEIENTLTVQPGPLHGATIETYRDHRMAMCFATLALHVPGIRLQNPGCVAKTFPSFFCKLAESPPHGLGVPLLDPTTGHRLDGPDLVAETTSTA